MKLLHVGVLLSLLLANWPQFRGPELNPVGANKRLPEQWSTTKNVEWSVEVPGRGWSSPIVVGDRVFLTTVTTDGRSKQPQIGTEYSNEYMISCPARKSVFSCSPGLHPGTGLR